MTTNVIKHPSNCPKCAICQCRCCITKRTKCSRVKKELIQSDILSKDYERRSILILVRHGMSQDEIDKRYSGWNDCDLSNIGKDQMHRTGQALHRAKFSIDICFTSLLKRAIKSLFIIQEEMDYLWLPVYNIWRLNDRMLGSLTGFHRDRAEALFGQNQIKEWLTRPELSPPLLEESNILHPRLNDKYRHISSIVPSTETLIDIRKRLLPFFYDQLLNNLYLGQNILVVTHEDILKSIIRLLNNYTVDEFSQQEIPIGIPIIFEFSLNTHRLVNGYYLSSTILGNNNQYQLFPTGFNDEKLNSTKEIIKQSPLVETKLDIHIKENFIGEIHLPTNLNTERPTNIKSIDNTDVSLNDKQEDLEFTTQSTAGSALYELATPTQPNQTDVAFSENAISSNQKVLNNCLQYIMDDNIINNDQWTELREAIKSFDERGDRTILNRVLVLIMQNIVESIDDDYYFPMDEDNGMEKQLVIALIEGELAEMIHVNACPSWCCRRRRISPMNENNHKFSNYLINLARAKSFDTNNTGFISKEIIQRIFAGQLTIEKMAEVLQFVEINNDGNINYRDFATLMLIAG